MESLSDSLEECPKFMSVPAPGLECVAVGTQGDCVAAVIPAAFRVLDDVIDLQDGITVVGVADGFRVPASRVLATPL